MSKVGSRRAGRRKNIAQSGIPLMRPLRIPVGVIRDTTTTSTILPGLNGIVATLAQRLEIAQ